MIPPKTSGEFIADRAENVKIKIPALHEVGNILIEEINSGQLSLKSKYLQSEFHPKAEHPHALDWLFVVNCLSGSFWISQGRPWRVDKNKGSFALCAAINRAIKDHVDILNPHFYSTITMEKLQNVLRGDCNVKLPLLQERTEALNDAGTCLVNHFHGSFRNCVQLADNSALKLLAILADNFKCFRDESEYKGSKVGFYKKAQMLIADIWICFKNQGIGYFNDIHEITAFAEYRVPQILIYYNVLWYSDELWQKIRSSTNLDYGSDNEVEIRGCTIHAVDLLTRYVTNKLHEGKSVNAVLIDHFLWDSRMKNGREIFNRKLMYHQTQTIHY